MVKYYAAEMSERAPRTTCRSWPAPATLTDYPVERYWRDARLARFEGTSEIMLKIVDALLGKPSRRS